MAPARKPEPTAAAVADLHRACRLPAPMVVVARDAVHFARLVRAWTPKGFPGPVFLTGLLVVMLAANGLRFLRSSEVEIGAQMSAYLSLLVTELLAPMRSRRDLCAAALSSVQPRRRGPAFRVLRTGCWHDAWCRCATPPSGPRR